MHAAVPWITTQAPPQRPQSVTLVHKSTSSSRSPSQSSSRLLHVLSSSAILVHGYSQPLLALLSKSNQSWAHCVKLQAPSSPATPLHWQLTAFGSTLANWE